MAKRLIMHIGMPKTGSTGVVDFLRKNSKKLLANGVAFPQKGRIRFLQDGDGSAALTDAWDMVGAAMNQGCETVLISDEDLYGRLLERPDRIQAIRKNLKNPEITALLYLRRQDILLESLYREIIRGKANPVLPMDYSSILQVTGPHFFDYDIAVRFFQSEFGVANVIVRRYELDALERGNLFYDFCSAINVPWSRDFVLPDEKTNKAADARLMDIFLTTNAMSLPFDGATRQFNLNRAEGAH